MILNIYDKYRRTIVSRSHIMKVTNDIMVKSLWKYATTTFIQAIAEKCFDNILYMKVSPIDFRVDFRILIMKIRDQRRRVEMLRKKSQGIKIAIFDELRACLNYQKISKQFRFHPVSHVKAPRSCRNTSSRDFTIISSTSILWSSSWRILDTLQFLKRM